MKISGTGKMSNLNNSTETENISDGAGTYPWANLKDSITNIVIADGVTSIGSKAFIAYTNVTSVNIGKDVSEIGVGARLTYPPKIAILRQMLQELFLTIQRQS